MKNNNQNQTGISKAAKVTASKFILNKMYFFNDFNRCERKTMSEKCKIMYYLFFFEISKHFWDKQEKKHFYFISIKSPVSISRE